MKWFQGPCGRQRESISLLASGALPEEEAGAVESHLAACAACRKYYEEVRGLTAPLADWERTYAFIEPSEAAQLRWSEAVLRGWSQPRIHIRGHDVASVGRAIPRAHLAVPPRLGRDGRAVASDVGNSHSPV